MPHLASGAAGFGPGLLGAPASTRQHTCVATVGARDNPYKSIGSKRDLDRFLAEYHLSEDQCGDLIRVRTPPTGIRGAARPVEYLVHEALLRSHGAFPCAGDAEALAFCHEIADEMVRAYNISRTEAVARLNRQFSTPDDPCGRVPRIWIVGRDLVYHDDAAYWATGIYHGFGGRWWDADADRRPLPPPERDERSVIE